jgi:K+-sensing histidine kinase KdpD
LSVIELQIRSWQIDMSISKSTLTVEELEARLRDERSKVEQARHWIEALTHELKTHFTTIIFSIDAMDRKSPYAEKARGALDSITDVLHRVASEFSGEAMVARARIEPCKIVKILRTCIARCVSPDRINFNCSIEEDVAIESDPVLVAVVVNNLLDNALSYSSRSGSVNVSIVSKGQGVSVIVANNLEAGTTFESERVFEKYCRGGLSPARGSGMGVGLPLSREIASLIGGALSCVPDTARVEFELWIPG